LPPASAGLFYFNFGSEDGGEIFLLNVGLFLTYMTLQTRRECFSRGEPQIQRVMNHDSAEERVRGEFISSVSDCCEHSNGSSGFTRGGEFAA
jgi:hypothetical protein